MKVFEGIVTSAKLNKTVTVKVSRYFLHPLYKKRIKLTKKFLCHDEIGVKEGETVSIQECRPISAQKHFIVLKMLKGATEATKSGVGIAEEKKKANKTSKEVKTAQEVKNEAKVVEKVVEKKLEKLTEVKSAVIQQVKVKPAEAAKKPAKVTKKK